jgi:flagellar hook assembly protein FlgD
VGEVGGPGGLALAVHPNPFRRATSVDLTLVQPGPVLALVYDVSGRVVRHLLEGPKAAGRVSIPWNGRNDSGGLLPSGIYLVHVRGAGMNVSRRVVLLN